MKKFFYRRIMAFTLTFMLVFGMVPATVFASYEEFDTGRPPPPQQTHQPQQGQQFQQPQQTQQTPQNYPGNTNARYTLPNVHPPRPLGGRDYFDTSRLNWAGSGIAYLYISCANLCGPSQWGKFAEDTMSSVTKSAIQSAVIGSIGWQNLAGIDSALKPLLAVDIIENLGGTLAHREAQRVCRGYGAVITQSLVASNIPGVRRLAIDFNSVLISPPRPQHPRLLIRSSTLGSPPVRQGTTTQFYAILEGAGNQRSMVTWSVTGGNAGTHIDPTSGLLTVDINQSTVENLRIRAVSTVNPLVYGTLNVQVGHHPTIATSVTISPANPTVQRSSQIDFNVEILATGGHWDGNAAIRPHLVVWTVEGNTSVNTRFMPTSAANQWRGRLFVAPDEQAETLLVRATSSPTTDTSNFTPSLTYTNIGETVVNVTGSAVSAINISPRPESMERDSTIQLSATVQGVGNFSQDVVWSVSNNNNPYTRIDSEWITNYSSWRKRQQYSRNGDGTRWNCS